MVFGERLADVRGGGFGYVGESGLFPGIYDGLERIESRVEYGAESFAFACGQQGAAKRKYYQSGGCQLEIMSRS